MIAVAIVALVAGGFGGFMVSVFMEVYFQRRAQEQVGAYDPPEVTHRRS